MSQIRGAVLVVESHHLTQQLAARLVARWGFEPIAVRGWARALVEHRSRAPDVVGAVLSVTGSDGVGGPVLLAALREAAPDLPCVFVCSYADPATATGLLAPGRTRLVTKPFDLARFEAAARELFTRP